jgi:DNA repair protein RecO (recombination protein O)
MPEVTRVLEEPAWLLHHRPFRDTSRILEIVTRSHGRLSLVARGSRSAKSRLRGILRPFMPLSVSWVSRSELGTLTGAEINGPPVSLSGDALLSGYYVNELLINLMHRHDPQPEIFDAYATTVRMLAAEDAIVPRLRHFEMELLRLLGYALNLDHEIETNVSLAPERHYEYRAEQGPIPVHDRQGPMIFCGRELQSIGRRQFDQPGILECANRLLRGVIAYHLNGKELKSRKVLRDIRRAAIRRDS